MMKSRVLDAEVDPLGVQQLVLTKGGHKAQRERRGVTGEAGDERWALGAGSELMGVGPLAAQAGRHRPFYESENPPDFDFSLPDSF